MTTAKRNGRPRISEDDETVSVNVRLPAKVFDQAYARARRERTTIQELIRRGQRDRKAEKEKQ